jgi:hypothetical protein
MPNDDLEVQAAESVGLTREQFQDLVNRLAPLLRPEGSGIEIVRLIQNPHSADQWDEEIVGEMWRDDLRVAFRFMILWDRRNGREEPWRGCGRDPDWYRVSTADGTVLFEGQVKNPEDQQDEPGWTRYGLFKVVRVAAEYAVNIRDRFDELAKEWHYADGTVRRSRPGA